MTLWAVSIQGPDDIYAFSTRAKAERFAELSEAFFKTLPSGGNYPTLSAEVVPWPYAPESHAKALRNWPEDALIESYQRWLNDGAREAASPDREGG